MAKFKFTEVAEIASVVATVPAFISNQLALACIPVSLAFALNIFNRKSLIAQAEQLVQNLQNQNSTVQAELSSVSQHYSNLQGEVGQLQLSTSQLTSGSSDIRSQIEKMGGDVAHLQEFTTQQYRQDRNATQEAIAKIETGHARSTAEILEFQEQLTVSQTLNAQLFQFAQQWEKQYESWEREKSDLTSDLSNKMDSLSSHLIYTLNPNPVSFYECGLQHSHKGEWEAGLAEYDKAIEMASEYAEAYRERGLAKAQLGDKKGAVADLRKSAQLFFDKGDIDSYHQTRDLTKNLHEFNVLENSIELEPASVENLFG